MLKVNAGVSFEYADGVEDEREKEREMSEFFLLLIPRAVPPAGCRLSRGRPVILECPHSFIWLHLELLLDERLKRHLRRDSGGFRGKLRPPVLRMRAGDHTSREVTVVAQLKKPVNTAALVFGSRKETDITKASPPSTTPSPGSSAATPTPRKPLPTILSHTSTILMPEFRMTNVQRTHPKERGVPGLSITEITAGSIIRNPAPSRKSHEGEQLGKAD